MVPWFLLWLGLDSEWIPHFFLVDVLQDPFHELRMLMSRLQKLTYRFPNRTVWLLHHYNYLLLLFRLIYYWRSTFFQWLLTLTHSTLLRNLLMYWRRAKILSIHQIIICLLHLYQFLILLFQFALQLTIHISQFLVQLQNSLHFQWLRAIRLLLRVKRCPQNW